MQRNTVQRAMILKTVRAMTNHPTADEVYERVLRDCPMISKGTVYRDLNRLASEGKILRVEIANAPDRYDLTVHGHAHCFCNGCGRVYDCFLSVKPQLDDEKNDGFVVKSINVVVSGICKECVGRLNG